MATRALGLDAYRAVTAPGTVDLLWRLAERVRGQRLLHVNSTRYGGGVAEMLHRYVPLFEELGVPARWEVIRGTGPFFATTKAFHNALQGMEQVISQEMLDAYVEVNRENAARLDLDADVVINHDPQPAALVEARTPGARWVWRCHIDVSRPQRRVWAFLRQFVVRHDAAVFSLPQFAQRLPIPQYQIYPSIDPLSDKNRDLSPEEVDAVLAHLEIPRDKPILLQVSRFDRFKDPIGVVNAHRIVKKYDPCRLVLAGGEAADDPEGAQVLADVQRAAAGDPDVHVLVLPSTAHVEINALQRAATIVLQKSTKEGFGLTVAEAMWKGKPVIGGAAGGITTQIVYGVTGYTVNSVEGAAYHVRRLLNNPDLAVRLGENAREYVRHRFLMTRDIADHLAVMIAVTR